jgi:hypothetical protein
MPVRSRESSLSHDIAHVSIARRRMRAA